MTICIQEHINLNCCNYKYNYQSLEQGLIYTHVDISISMFRYELTATNAVLFGTETLRQQHMSDLSTFGFCFNYWFNCCLMSSAMLQELNTLKQEMENDTVISLVNQKLK